MTTMAPLPKDDPRMVAWQSYRLSDDYENTRRWALQEAHVDGSLWAAFVAGWAANTRPASDVGDEVERLKIAFCASLMNANAGMKWLDHDSMDELIEAAWVGFEDAAIATLSQGRIAEMREALASLALAAGGLNVATDGMERLRPQRQRVLAAISDADATLRKADGGGE